MKQIETIIRDLINSKKEGNYWDFKENPHDNKADLLHDILCLANARHKGDRYLIYGVSDPNTGSNLMGLSPGMPNRKNQQQFIDFYVVKRLQVMLDLTLAYTHSSSTKKR